MRLLPLAGPSLSRRSLWHLLAVRSHGNPDCRSATGLVVGSRRARDKPALEAVVFGHHRAIFEILEDRRLLAYSILIAHGGVTSIPAARITFSDNSILTIDPIAFASAGADIDLRAYSITFQNAVSVRSGFALIAEATTILVNASVATTGANLTLDAGGSISDSAPGKIACNGVVTLNAGGPIGSSDSRLQFDATATPAQVVIGSVTQPAGVYLAGLGNLSLGNITSAVKNGPLDVTAPGNLTVLAGAIIQTGSGTISLAADVKADGSGDDGVGRLSIGAGAVVVSSNPTTSAITLRGADVNIDTSANPADVGWPQHTLSTTPNGALTGLNGPQHLAFDAQGDLYVANFGFRGNGTTVSEFAPEATAPMTTLSGLSNPGAMAIDGNGDLYVVNGVAAKVCEFAPGATTPTATLTGLTVPGHLAFDGNGNLFVANYVDGTHDTVSEFAPGATTPTATLTGVSNPGDLAFDGNGNLFVANGVQSGTVSEFAPGATTPTATLSTGTFPGLLAFDPSGNLYVAGGSGWVSKFAPGATTPTAWLSGVSVPVALAVDPSGNLYVDNLGNNTVSEFAPGATTPTATFAGLWDSYALAIDPGGNLYVANSDANTVSEFAPGVSSPTAGGVLIRSSLPTRPMNLGGANDAVAGVNLTDAELAQLFTIASGTITFGDNSQTGNITFTTAVPATTAGASTVVVQSASGPGEIVLDDGGGAGTALDGNGGTISLTAGSGGIATPNANNFAAELGTTGAVVTINTNGPVGTASSRIQFADNPNTAEQNLQIGSTNQPGSVFLDGLGSLTLGSIQGGLVNAPIDVTARTNLVVAANATIDSGAGTLSLGADLDRTARAMTASAHSRSR